MATFSDNKQTKWILDLNVATFEAILSATGIDFLTKPGPSCEEIAANPYRLAEVVYVACKAQADALGLEPKTFAALLEGDVLADASDAILEAITYFFQQTRSPLGPIMRALADRGAQQKPKFDALVDAQIAAGNIDAIVDAEYKKLAAALERHCGKLSTNLQESSESTPAPGHSDSSRPPSAADETTKDTSPPTPHTSSPTATLTPKNTQTDFRLATSTPSTPHREMHPAP